MDNYVLVDALETVRPTTKTANDWGFVIARAMVSDGAVRYRNVRAVFLQQRVNNESQSILCDIELLKVELRLSAFLFCREP